MYEYFSSQFYDMIGHSYEYPFRLDYFLILITLSLMKLIEGLYSYTSVYSLMIIL